MKTLNVKYIITLLALCAFGIKSKAQAVSGNTNTGDTVTYVLYKDTV